MVGTGKPRLKRADWLLLAISGALMVSWNVYSWHFPFFWDSVSHSRIATWYLETNFSSITIPEEYDAGHPPFFNLYLAMAWRLFGRTLASAHLAMLPLLALILIQYHRLTMRWLSPIARPWAMLLLFCEPTFLTQAGMVSADVGLMAFYLLALNALLDERRCLAASAMLLLCAMSFRGILMAGALFITEVAFFRFAGSGTSGWRRMLTYAPVAILVLAWLTIHHAAVGWWISPPPATYGGQRELLGLRGMAWNAALIGWRLVDLGRVFLWLFVFVAGFSLGWAKIRSSRPSIQALVALAAPTLFLSLLFIPFSNPVGHRYYLVSYLMLSILAVNLAEMKGWSLRRRIGLTLVGVGLATGHWWIYPEGIAKGWDASLAHLPVFRLEERQQKYLKSSHIVPSEVCADFPFLHSPYITRLIGQKQEPWLRNFLEESDCKWALYSNVNNGFSNSQITEFRNPGIWEEMHRETAGFLFMRLYRRRGATPNGPCP
jgi:hypothetical protein